MTTLLSTTTSRFGLSVMEGGQIKFKEFIAAGLPLEEHGVKVEVKGVIFRRNTRIRILSNNGSDDLMFIGGERNREIVELGAFRLDTKLSEFEERHNTKVTDQALFQAAMELHVTPSQNVRLLINIPDVAETLEFETNAAPC
jgi:hypothetical protein